MGTMALQITVVKAPSVDAHNLILLTSDTLTPLGGRRHGVLPPQITTSPPLTVTSQLRIPFLDDNSGLFFEHVRRASCPQVVHIGARDINSFGVKPERHCSKPTRKSPTTPTLNQNPPYAPSDIFNTRPSPKNGLTVSLRVPTDYLYSLSN